MLRRLAVRTGSVLGVSVLALTAVAAMPGDAIAGLPGARKLMTRAPYLTDLTKSSGQAFDVRTYSFGPFRPAAAQQRHGPRMPG
jgi:hypothetical protein